MADDASTATGGNYAISIADGSYVWYRSRAILTRRAHRISEVALLVVSTSIPVAGVISSSSATVPAILGAVVVVISGLRSVFQWHDNYLRFSAAREAVEAERRLYRTQSDPYDDERTRDEMLVKAITRIEREEMSNWLKLSVQKGESVRVNQSSPSRR